MVSEIEQGNHILLSAKIVVNELLRFFDDEVTDFKVSIFGSKVQGCVPFTVWEAKKVGLIYFIFDFPERLLQHSIVAIGSSIEEDNTLLLETSSLLFWGPLRLLQVVDGHLIIFELFGS